MIKTTDTLLLDIEEVLSKLNSGGSVQTKIVDICLELRSRLRIEQKRKGNRPTPKRDRALYMRRYRASKRGPSTGSDGTHLQNQNTSVGFP